MERKESDASIIVIQNGYGEMVLMSIPLYEKTIADAQADPVPSGF